MKTLLAKLFRLLFKIEFIKSRHFGIYKKIFKPLGLFDNVTCTIRQDGFRLRLKVDDWIQHKMYFVGGYEESELQLLRNFVNEGNVFIDAGANIGLYSLHASKWVGSGGRVISFEPLSANFSSLTDHISMNKLSNVRPEKLALGNKNDLVTIAYDPTEKNLGMASTNHSDKGVKEKIKMITLDSYLHDHAADLKRVDFIKIDIEGHEYAALTGMHSTLTTFRPALLIEILEDTTNPANEQNILEYLKKMGYRKFFINDSGNLSETEQNPLRRNFLFTAQKL